MTKRVLHNHLSRINHFQHANFTSLIPGMFINFVYKSENAFDKRPLVLFLYNDEKTDLVHALNLNYLNASRVRRLFGVLNMNFDVVTKQTANNERQLYAPYTWCKLPGIRDNAESLSQMDLFYRTVIKTKLLPEQGDNIYRTFKRPLMSGIRAVNFRRSIL